MSSTSHVRVSVFTPNHVDHLFIIYIIIIIIFLLRPSIFSKIIKKDKVYTKVYQVITTC